MKYEHKHKIYSGNRCATCALTRKTWTMLDKLDAEHKPYSHHCSTCGAHITDEEDFENFALATFQSLHTICEKCVKLHRKYNK